MGYIREFVSFLTRHHRNHNIIIQKRALTNFIQSQYKIKYTGICTNQKTILCILLAQKNLYSFSNHASIAPLKTYSSITLFIHNT